MRDSTFVFGSTGTGRASLAINGFQVPVAPNGAFLAFLPVPGDGVYRFDARTASARDTLTLRVDVPAAPSASVTPAPTRLVEGSAYPSGGLSVAAGERVDVGIRGPAGGTARLVLPDGSTVPLVERRLAGGVSEYSGWFAAQRLETADTSVAWPELTGESRGAQPLPRAPILPPNQRPDAVPLGEESGDRAARFEVVVGLDTLRSELPLNLTVVDLARPRVGIVDDPRPLAERGDAQIIARPGPGGGPYDYFWPDGTRLTLIGERDGAYHVRLTDDLTVWSPASEIELAPVGTPPAESRVGNVNIHPRSGWIEVRIPMSARLPFKVSEVEGRTSIDVYGALSRTNRVDYGQLDPFIERAEWDQPSDELYRFSLYTDGWSWGHDVAYDGTTLVLRVRRPPAIDRRNPLRGRTIAVDAGHGGPASGATGPTGLMEKEVTLAVARRIAARLQAQGATPVLIRDRDVDIALEERVQTAVDAGAEILLSVHMDAFPDGINPYRAAGTHMFYFHPRAADLARHLQEEVLGELGLPDLGIARADFAMARTTWMPAVLTESVFMMIPQWEAALRDPEVIDRLAAAHVRAVADFLAQRAGD